MSRYDILMNILWYEEVPPSELADKLGITEQQFFDKLCGYEDFTMKEIAEMVALFGMTGEETDRIFFG